LFYKNNTAQALTNT